MQVEIQEQEARVKASDIKVGDVITWGNCDLYSMCYNSEPNWYELVILNGVNSGEVNNLTNKDVATLSNFKIVTNKCKLVVSL